MSVPYVARAALLEALKEVNEIQYEELKKIVLATVEKECGLRYVPFDQLLDEAFEHDVIEFIRPGVLRSSASIAA